MPRKKKIKGKPKRFAAKYRIKGAEDWTKYFFWATDETEAKKIWEENERSNRHRKFLFESLVDLDNELKKYQISLYVKIGEPLNIFHDLLSKYGKFSVFFHHETNTNYHRLKVEQIKKWFHNNSIDFHEYQKNAVVEIGRAHV